MAEGAFEKDFGYLMPFLDKVAAATDSISDLAAREEFNGLVSGEKERWMRIRQLLSGATREPSKPPEKISDSNPNDDSPNEQAADEPASERFQFTVGSLRPGNR